MTDHTHSSHGAAGDGASREVAEDLGALARMSRLDAPTLAETARRIAAREAERGKTMGERLAGIGPPAWGVAAAVAAIALVLLFVPVSFDRTIGHELQLRVEGTQLAGADADGLAEVLHKQLGDAPLAVRLGENAEVTGEFRGKSRAEVAAVASALVKELSAKGLTARYEVAPITEQVSSNVYAYAASQFRDLTVSTAGRSDFEVENEIRAQLQGMGFLNPDVRFTRGDDGSELRFEAEDAQGHKVGGEARHEMKGGSPGQEPDLNILMIDPAELKGKSEAEMKAIVERRLRERGVHDATVTVENGKVKVEATQHIQK